jgi:hypothetical protein
VDVDALTQDTQPLSIELESINYRVIATVVIMYKEYFVPIVILRKQIRLSSLLR